MTKTDELVLLEHTIGAFGPNSYIGPWLSDYRLELEADIRADLPIEVPSPMRARNEAIAILRSAELEAIEIRKRATERAQAELIACRKECQDLRDSLRENVRQALGRFLDRF